MHHLAVDRVSWRIILEDLGLAYEQAAQGLPQRLPHKTTAFRDWSRRLAEYARSEELAAEAERWLRLERAAIPALEPDYPHGGNSEADVRTASVFLDASETEALVQQAGKAYGTEVNEALLTALALAFERWTGRAQAYVEVEGHGRAAELLAQGGAAGNGHGETVNLVAHGGVVHRGVSAAADDSGTGRRA